MTAVKAGKRISMLNNTRSVLIEYLDQINKMTDHPSNVKGAADMIQYHIEAIDQGNFSLQGLMGDLAKGIGDWAWRPENEAVHEKYRDQLINLSIP
jgi:hypothetical protein